MSDSEGGTFHARPIRGRSPQNREVGRVDSLTPTNVLLAMKLVTAGEVYDLDSGRWPGMPLYTSEPPFQVLAYRTPPGLRAQADFAEWTGTSVRFGWLSDLVIGGTHAGTHIDALSHMTIGDDDHWFGGHVPTSDLGDFGPLAADAAAIPPIVTRGVLIDVATYKGVDALPAGYAISVDDIRGALLRQGDTQVGPGDAALLRTGYMKYWDTPDASKYWGAGVGHDAGQWLAERGVVAIGADTEGMEAYPSGDPTNPFPLHTTLLIQHGVYIIEILYLEALARSQRYDFLFLCLTPRISGATGGLVRAVAVI